LLFASISSKQISSFPTLRTAQLCEHQIFPTTTTMATREAMTYIFSLLTCMIVITFSVVSTLAFDVPFTFAAFNITTACIAHTAAYLHGRQVSQAVILEQHLDSSGGNMLKGQQPPIQSIALKNEMRNHRMGNTKDGRISAEY
jgi:hypothetical protein